MINFKILFIVFFATILQTAVSFGQWIQRYSPYEARAFCAAPTMLFAGTYGQGVVHSTDGGITWTSSNNGIPTVNILSLTIDSLHIYAGTDSGVFRSTDNGTNWVSENSGMATDCSVFGFMKDGKSIYAATSCGVFISPDHGTTWQQSNGTMDKSLPPNYGVLSIALSGSRIFIGTSSGIFTTTDQGTTWNPSSNGLPNTTVFALLPIDINIYAGTRDGLFVSTNQGANWKAFSTNVSDVRALAISDSNIFVGTSGSDISLFKTDGTHEIISNDGFLRTDVFSLFVNGTTIYAGMGDGIWSRPLSEVIKTDDVLSSFKTENAINSFPNPFSRSTSIKFSISDHSFAQISIYNLLGSEVARIFSGELESGEHIFSWDAHGRPGGMYIAVVKIGGVVEETPLLLVE